jgi:hypothetical protein
VHAGECSIYGIFRARATEQNAGAARATRRETGLRPHLQGEQA